MRLASLLIAGHVIGTGTVSPAGYFAPGKALLTVDVQLHNVPGSSTPELRAARKAQRSQRMARRKRQGRR